MPRCKSWKKGKAKRGNVNATKKVSDGGKCDLFLTDELTEDLTEELASLKTENSDTLRDVTEELASLKTENKDIVQGSANLVTLKKVESNLPVNYLYNSQSQKGKDEVLVSHRNQRESLAESVNEHHMFFGGFHQNDARFSDQSRGFQCTCNALCMLSYHTACTQIENSSSLDKILCDGDSLYQDVTAKLKAELRFIHPLLSLDELPDDFEIEIGKFSVEKDPIECGFLVDTQENSGLPTLHNALQSALSSSKSCLLTIGAVCSAVFMRNNLYMFFDSHSHGEHGLSSVDGKSILISFSSLDDLVGYLYAFYDSMKIDMNLQFDLLPVNVRNFDAVAQRVTDESIPENMTIASENAKDTLQLQGKCHTESFAECITKEAEYFAEVFSLEAALFSKHSANNVFNIHQDFDDTFAKAFIGTAKTSSKTDDITFENENVGLSDAESEAEDNNVLKQFPTVKKRKKRSEYNIIYKKKQRQDPSFREKECAAKRNERQDPQFIANEKNYQAKSKRKERQDAAFKTNELNYQVKSKQRARQNPSFRATECTVKRKERQDAAFKTNELNYQVKSKQRARQNPSFRATECTVKRKERQDAAFKTNELKYQVKSKQRARQNPSFRATECTVKQKERQVPAFKTKELNYQGQSKQRARRVPAFKANELNYQVKSKQRARRDPLFQSNEAIYQRISKQNARKRPLVLESERIKQQQKRQQTRNLNESSVLNNEKSQSVEEASHSQMSCKSKKKGFKAINDCIKEFHLSISVGPLYVCTCCHQTWFRKSVSMLKNTHIPKEIRRLYCTKFTSVNGEEWVCHTCLNSLKNSKVPRLSVANGMKWPDKPQELNLHQLEERLIALRIPFMQIRELPRGGQYSLKGNVINVPVDIQPTISCLPRPMDENFTVAIQLKKKLSYKTVDFKENVRPLRVLTALHWLVNNSEFYKNSGIAVNDNWHQEVTESAEETVKEFLEVTTEETSSQKKNQINKDASLTAANDWTETDGYDSDHYSEIDANDQVGNVDTLVDDADIENKYDQVFTFAPGEGQHPLSLYLDKDAEYLCFPSIFCGQRRPDNEDRLVQLHYSDIVKWELRSVDRRAAQSVPNIFFKHKKLQMKQISDKVNLAVRRCKNKGKKITVAEARDSKYLDKLVQLDEGYYIFRQLRNSPAYLEARKKDIFAMIRQLSLPTWFMSLSAADTRWTDLLQMLARLNDDIEYSEEELENLSWQEKTKLVQKDPVTCSRYFDHRVQEFLNTVIKSSCEPIGKVKDFFYRVEFQQRGSPHIHMLVWIENAPNLERSSREEIEQFVDNYLTCSTDNEETVNLVKLQTHKHSRTCRKKGKPICRFGFPIPPFPRTMLLYPLDEEVEKYKTKYSLLQKVMNECKDTEGMSFDEFLEKVAKMEFDEYVKCIRSSLKAPKVFLDRKPNEMRINLFNGKILLAWKANLDIQIVLEPYGCASYIVGYISKSQRGMSAQLDAAAKEARKGNLDLKKQVRHIGNVFSNCVEVSAQEAVYLDLQIPLTKCTRDIVFINTSTTAERVFLLKPKSVLDELPAESTDIESSNVIQRYSKRPKQLSKFCLADYVSKVDVIYPKGDKLPEKFEEKNEDEIDESSSSDENENCLQDESNANDSHTSVLLYEAKNGTKYKKRKVPRIIRYVRYNKKNDSENYYREQLMLFIPWRNEEKDLISGFETFEAHYKALKISIESKSNEYEHHAEELELARQMMEDEDNAYDQIAPNAEQENREAEDEGIIEADKFVYFNPNRVVEQRHYDIGIELQSSCSVPPEETTGIMLPDDEYLTLLRNLNLRQREFFNHVIHWIKCKDTPIYAFLTGGAGVGKSVVIRALYQSLYRILNLRDGENPDDIRILLCAYMGFAAFNISGQTICSAFHKKMYQGTNLLSADELNTFRIKYRHLKVVIIDEISMVGNITLSFIDTRLQQLTGTKAAFGGLSVIAVGDLYQLKPVKDFLICLDLKEGASSLARNLWKELFTMYELVDIMRQKDDLDFAHLLNRLRLNEMTEEDKEKLQTRIVDRDSDDYPKDALHLFAENKFVDEHNNNILSQMPGEKVVIPSHDSVVSANIPAKECQNLINKLSDDYTKTGRLMKSLTLVVGMIVAHTANVDVEDGLTNGATGVVKYIDYRMEETNRPSIVWVLFDDPRIGRTAREKYRKLYNRNIDREWTPVFDVQRTFIVNYKTYQRIQFPLTPASGKSVWKAEGATVDEVVVDLSQFKRIRKIPHIHYVALSRVKKLENLYILNMNEGAIDLDEQVTTEMHRLRTEASLELCYVPLYKVQPDKVKIAFNNARSLNKHFQDIEHEPNVLAADVIGFAESRLCARDQNVHFSLRRCNLVRLDDTQYESLNRPSHGLALYMKEYLEVQKLVKLQCQSCEFIYAALHSRQKGRFQVVILYKYPKSSQRDFKTDLQCHLRPVVDLNAKLVILGDFNIQIECVSSQFVHFMETLFSCVQHIGEPTCDFGSTLDLVFANCHAFCDVIEAYWSDHKLVYCAFDK